MRVLLIAAALLAAGAAQASDKRFGVHLLAAPLIADVDVDELKFDGGGKQDGDDDDLEKNIGVAGTFEFVKLDRFRIGARVAFMTAEGDDTELDHRTIDGGGWARYVFMTGDLQPFAAGGLGLTWASADGELLNNDAEASGIGWHLVLGGGVSYSISSAIDLFGGLYYIRQQIFEAEGEIGSTDVTLEDVVYARLMLAAGIMF